MNRGPQIPVLKPQLPGPQDVTIFGNRVFTEVVTRQAACKRRSQETHFAWPPTTWERQPCDTCLVPAVLRVPRLGAPRSVREGVLSLESAPVGLAHSQLAVEPGKSSARKAPWLPAYILRFRERPCRVSGSKECAALAPNRPQCVQWLEHNRNGLTAPPSQCTHPRAFIPASRRVCAYALVAADSPSLKLEAVQRCPRGRR